MNCDGRKKGKERSQWRRMFLYTRCFCFGCTANDPQKTNVPDDDTGSMSSIQENNSLHLPKETKKLSSALLGRALVPSLEARKKGGSLFPADGKNNVKEMKEKTQSQASHGGVLVSNRELSTMKHRPKTKYLSLLTTSKDANVLLDLGYLTQAFRILKSANQWSFNIFTLNKLTNGRSLFYLTFHLFHHYDFLKVFQLDVMRLMHCLTLIESSYYFSNPYHNSVHAADVVQAMFVHLNEPQIANCLKPVEKMAAILSAACHDVDHPGTNQGFQIATSNPLCGLYDNVSVLENHHWRSTVGILIESKLFEHLDRQTWLRIKFLVQTMILATDITKQSEILAVFRGYLNGNNLNLASDEQHRTFILQMTLKCADISNPCRPWQMSKCWSELICEEFYKQGDCERKLGLPVTSFCDRSQSTIATIQTGFMTHVAEPLFLEWHRFASTLNSKMMLANLRHNRRRWECQPQQPTISSNPANQITTVAVAEKDRDGTSSETLEAVADGNATPAGELTDFGTDWKRRRSLPTDSPLLALPTPTPNNRRLSLPNTTCSNHVGLFPLISRLTPLSENLPGSEQPKRQSKTRRFHGNGVAMETVEDCAEQQRQVNRDDEEFSDAERKFCPPGSGVATDAEQRHGNGCHGNGKTEDFVGLQPNGVLLNRKKGGCHHMARKMSLIVPRDSSAMTVAVGRKRSRSLVTSSMTYDDNVCSILDLASNGQLITDQLLATCAGHAWTTWWRKKTRNHFCTTKVPESARISEVERPSAGLGQAEPAVQLLSCQCPVVMTRVIETHCHPSKGIISRRATSVFAPASAAAAAAEDAEAIPLLASDAAGSIWNNEM